MMKLGQRCCENVPTVRCPVHPRVRKEGAQLTLHGSWRPPAPGVALHPIRLSSCSSFAACPQSLPSMTGLPGLEQRGSSAGLDLDHCRQSRKSFPLSAGSRRTLARRRVCPCSRLVLVRNCSGRHRGPYGSRHDGGGDDDAAARGCRRLA